MDSSENGLRNKIGDKLINGRNFIDENYQTLNFALKSSLALAASIFLFKSRLFLQYQKVEEIPKRFFIHQRLLSGNASRVSVDGKCNINFKINHVPLISRILPLRILDRTFAKHQMDARLFGVTCLDKGDVSEAIKLFELSKCKVKTYGKDKEKKVLFCDVVGHRKGRISKQSVTEYLVQNGHAKVHGEIEMSLKDYDLTSIRRINDRLDYLEKKTLKKNK